MNFHSVIMDFESLQTYIEQHISPEPPHLRALARDVNTELLYTRMCSGHFQGRILKMLTMMINPRRVLEIGTYAGYSALSIAEGLSRPDAMVDTIEVEEELEDFITAHLKSSPYASRINLYIGDAMEIIPRIDQGLWDIVYIDANKRTYVEYFNLVIDRIPHGGYIIADNTLWDGKILDLKHNTDAQTTGIARFNDLVASDPRVETVILPLRDGLTLIRKR